MQLLWVARAVQDFEKLTPHFLDLLRTTMLERLKRTVEAESGEATQVAEKQLRTG